MLEVESDELAAPAVVNQLPTFAPLIVLKIEVDPATSSMRYQARALSARTWYSQYDGNVMRFITLNASEAVTIAVASLGFVYC